MSTFTTQIVIPSNRRIDLELPHDVPEGEATVTVTVEPQKKITGIADLCGQEKGKIWMSDDFDEPLDLVKAAPGKPVNRMAELEGKYVGQIWMADDFDAPLEDFAEYV